MASYESFVGMRRILVVDDDDDAREVIRMKLNAEGFEVLEAANGTEAGKFHLEGPIDLIITDIFMPEMDGIELLLESRRKFPGTRLIAISGNPDFDLDLHFSAAKLLGAERTLQKPFDLDEMVAAVKELLAV